MHPAGDTRKMLNPGVPPRVVAAQTQRENLGKLVKPKHKGRVVNAPGNPAAQKRPRRNPASHLPANEQRGQQRRQPMFPALQHKRHHKRQSRQRQKIGPQRPQPRRQTRPKAPHLVAPLRPVAQRQRIRRQKRSQRRQAVPLNRPSPAIRQIESGKPHRGSYDTTPILAQRPLSCNALCPLSLFTPARKS